MDRSTRKSGLSVLLVLTLILAVGAIVQDIRFDNAIARTRDAALGLDRDLGALDVAVSELRAAETGYLASGQGPGVWIRRASELLAQMETAIETLRAAAHPSAASHYLAAAEALADLSGIDQRARNSLANDQRSAVAELVFVEGLEASRRLSAELAGARTAEAAAADARVTHLARLRIGMNAVVIGFLLVVAFYVARLAGRQQPAASDAETTAEMIRNLPPPVKPAPTPALRTSHTSVAALNVSGAAELCTDLARVIDGRDVSALLERTAKVLEAKGVIVWTAATGGATLKPVLAHGYPEKILARLDALPADAENATSLAFRTLRPQAMNSNGAASPGAIAVPIINAGGCIGVLAAEIKDGRPAAEILPLAKIVAAQFATLISPSEAAKSEAAQA